LLPRQQMLRCHVLDLNIQLANIVVFVHFAYLGVWIILQYFNEKRSEDDEWGWGMKIDCGKEAGILMQTWQLQHAEVIFVLYQGGPILA